MTDDLIGRTRQELQQRIVELEEMTAELPRLKAALEALSEGTARSRPRRSGPPSTGARRARRRRGANREAILTVIGERPGVSVGEVAVAVE
jgi:hypothetical protein